MAWWYRVEQNFKKIALRRLEKIAARKILAPENITSAEIKRILVIRQHDMLGDFILSTPVLPALKHAFPHAHLGVLVREYFAEVVAAHRDVDEVLLFHEHGTRWTWRSARALWRQLRQRWDLVIVLNTVSHSLTSDLLAHFAKAKYVLGSEHRRFDGCSRNFFYNLLAPYSNEEKHQSERNLDIVRHIGVKPQHAAEVMYLTAEERARAAVKLREAGLQNGKFKIAMHVGAGKILNRWPVEKFAALAQRLHHENGAQILLFWGKNEGELAQKFRAQTDFQPLRIAPTSLREMAACFAQCHALVCNDTGVMHVGAAVNVPLVAIFGPTPPALWKPLGERFIAVRGRDETTASVPVAEVYDALWPLLENAGARESVLQTPRAQLAQNE
jgi:heptosyltransferase-2